MKQEKPIMFSKRSWKQKVLIPRSVCPFFTEAAQTSKKGLTVTTFYMAKGLEFDQVFSVFPGEDRSPIVERARYIAATRALHELYMYEVVK